MPNQRHIGEFGELDGGKGYSQKKIKLQGCKSNQKVKTKNDIYYRDEKHY